MLKRFEVTNFKNFNEKFVFDLSETKQYTFNEECVENGIVKTGMIYGPNGCGKSNLGYAIFDIKTHLTDDKINQYYKRDYLNAANLLDIAEFKYIFQFDKTIIEYTYGKNAVDDICYESLIIDNEEVISFNREESQIAEISLPGTQNLNKDFSDSDLSVVKYVGANTQYTKDNKFFFKFLIFVKDMSLMKPIESHQSFNLFPQTNWLNLLIDTEQGYTLEHFEQFLNSAGIKCRLSIINSLGEDRLAFNFGNNNIDFNTNASSGTLVLISLYVQLRILSMKEKLSTNFVYVDEFDAFYHHKLSQLVVQEFKNKNAQTILTTHNTSIMTNDLLRPDCYFTMTEKEIKPIYKHTFKELRKAHSIEKMYRAGAFSE